MLRIYGLISIILIGSFFMSLESFAKNSTNENQENTSLELLAKIREPRKSLEDKVTIKLGLKNLEDSQYLVKVFKLTQSTKQLLKSELFKDSDFKGGKKKPRLIFDLKVEKDLIDNDDNFNVEVFDAQNTLVKEFDFSLDLTSFSESSSNNPLLDDNLDLAFSKLNFSFDDEINFYNNAGTFSLEIPSPKANSSNDNNSAAEISFEQDIDELRALAKGEFLF